MANVQIFKTSEYATMDGGDAGSEQQLITVQNTPEDKIIMVTFQSPGTNNEDHIYEGHTVHGSTGATIKDNSTQTETVFGLEDLPTVKEIVRKTIAKSRKLEEEQNQRLQLETTPGPVNGIYTCTICAKVCRNKISWQNHLASHNGDEVYMCGVCGQMFNLRITLKAHIDIHVREERKMKKQRDLNFTSADLKIGGVYMPGDIIPKDDNKVLNRQLSLETGILINNQDGTHSESFVAATEEVHDMPSPEPIMKEEIENDGSIGPELDNDDDDPDADGSYVYACNICGVQYAKKKDCEKHLLVHTASPPVKLTSPPVGTSQSEQLKADEDSLSPPPSVSSPTQLDKDISPTKNKWSAYIYACNVCGKQYTNKSNCKRHMMIHTDDRKLYSCEFCGKGFSQKYEVRMHARIHTGEKPYSCAVCGKTFTERGNWRRHTTIHVRPQENSPYRCGICCKGFFQAEKLQVHLQIHSGQRPFICTVCGRKVKKIGDMYRHLRTHTGEKPYKCQVCGKGFAQNGNLKDHMKVHTGEKPHVCDLCGQGFARKILLKDHVKSQHRGTTLHDLTEAALEEIERQEAAMEGLDGTGTADETSVVHEISAANIGSVPRILSATAIGKTIVIGGAEGASTDEAAILQEEQELELQDVHSTLTEKELEAAHVLTVVQEGDNMLYTLNPSTNQVQQIMVRTTKSDGSIVMTSKPQTRSSTHLQNS